MKEFAQILGWETARLSTKYSRQREGQKIRQPLPKPIFTLAATPVWTKEQAEAYKNKVLRR